MTLSHKIALDPNNKQMTYFKKACGCARKAYNWGLSKWKEYYEKENKSVNRFDLNKEFNAIKKVEFPYMYEVTKYAVQRPFQNLGWAIDKFFRDLKQGKVSYPRFKKRKENYGSFYIGGDQLSFDKFNSKRVKIPKLGMVRMREKLRFDGKINCAVISEQAGKWFISFSVTMEENKYKQTQNNLKIGIDLGLDSLITISNGMKIQAPKPLKNFQKKVTKLSRQLVKKQHPKTKGDTTTKSNNYVKFSKKLGRLHARIKNIRDDYTHKVTTMIIRNFQHLSMETLNVKGMMKNHKQAKSISDVSWFELTRQIEYKSQMYGNSVLRVDTFYPSSKKCSGCGAIKKDLMLKHRTYKCESCGLILDRDLNASLNLMNEIKIPTADKAVMPCGTVMSCGKLTPVEKTALLKEVARQNLVTSFVEAGI